MNKLQAYDLVHGSDLCSSAKQIMCYLILRSNTEGNCFPSIRKISDDTNLSARTVQRKLRVLEAKNFIKCSSRVAKYGRRTSNLYTITILDTAYTNEISSLEDIEVINLEDILQEDKVIICSSEYADYESYELCQDNVYQEETASIMQTEMSDRNVSENEKNLDTISAQKPICFSISPEGGCHDLNTIIRLENKYSLITSIMMRLKLLLLYPLLIRISYEATVSRHCPVNIHKKHSLFTNKRLFYEYIEPP